jgi:hypothetical protein
MVIHKLIATCDCGNEKCIGREGALATVTISANSEAEIELITKLLEVIEFKAERVKRVVIQADQLPNMRAAIEDVYRIPEIAEGLGEALGLGDLIGSKKEVEDPFKDIGELELKEID